jgi:hypothetical protein
MLWGEARSVEENLLKRRGDYDGEDEYSAVKATIAGDSIIVLGGGGSVVPWAKSICFLTANGMTST